VVVISISIDLRIPGSRSLKEKRSVVRPIVEGMRHRFSLSVAEVDQGDSRQLAGLGVAIVSGDFTTAERLADDVERFVWSRPDIEVLEIVRQWHEQT
jgi:uncharacterized protein YlxP (DUF503 family)